MRNSKGFTLIELMIVVAIIGILSAIAVPKFADLIRKSNEGATKGNLGALRSALSIYFGENEGWFPSVGDPTASLTMENGKYIKAIPNSYCPPNHGKLSSFDTTVTSESAEGTIPGNWAYIDEPIPAANSRPWGDTWVNCSHTDSKGTQWGTY